MMKPSPSNLTLRIRSALVLLPLVIVPLWLGGVYYALLLGIIGGAMISEWQALGLYARDRLKRAWNGIGLVYIALPLASLFWLGLFAPQGMLHILWLAIVVWSTDIFAYVTGKSCGKHKLAPSISPGKTIEGLAGGVVAAAIAGAIFDAFYGNVGTLFPAMLFSAMLALVAQAGDLFESGIKRKLGVKDSGTLIPGHGGIFDRVDGILTASVATALLYAAGALPLFESLP